MSTIYEIEPPKLSAYKIECIAHSLLNDYVSYVFNKPQQTPISIMIEKYMNIDLDYKCLSNDLKTLGVTAFSHGVVEVYDDKRVKKYKIPVECGTIIIESDLLSEKNNGRCRFTIGHELGHWVLHKDICNTMFRCDDKPRELKTNRDWFEWQADTFSSALLMPRQTFVSAYNDICKNIKRRSYMDREEKSLFFDLVAEELALIFQVSFQAARIRIGKLLL